jgi:hypothetical protein
MLEKIKTIIAAYAEMVNPSEEMKVIAEKRLQTCFNCDKWVDAPISYCGECGCATRAKVFTPTHLKGCPLDKWEE